MGAPKGNVNAKSKTGRTRISVHLSIGDTPSNMLLSDACRYLENQGIESTDQAVAKFVKEYAYKSLRELLDKDKS